MEKPLGRGGFSLVHQAMPISDELITRSGGKPVAVKEFFRCADELKAEKLTVMFNTEVAILSDLARNDNFARLIGYSTEPKAIIMKIYGLGDFSDLIHLKKAHLKKIATDWSFSLVISLLTDFANALQYLHSKEISHNDVKPSNALLEQREDRLHVVLADFSFAEVRNAAKRGVKAFVFSDEPGLSIQYVSPEVILCMTKRKSAPDLKTLPVHIRDSYAFGIVIHEAVSRRQPYVTRETAEIMRFVLSGGRPDLLCIEGKPKNWKMLVEIAAKCWCPKPQDRIPLSKVLVKFQDLME